jgi:hypothetical protein
MRQHFRALTAGLATLVVMGFLWSYLTYDCLQYFSSDWFYRVNALWHEHPEPGLLSDHLFIVSLMLGGLLVFGSAGFVTSWLSPDRAWHPVLVVCFLGSAPALMRGLIALFTEAPVSFKIGFGVYLLAAWLPGIGFARLAGMLKEARSRPK